MEPSLAGRQKALIAFRLFFVTLLLGSFIVFEIGYSIFPNANAVLYLIVVLYFLSFAYALLLGKVNAAVLAYAQVVVDLLAAAALIIATGGIESWFSWLLLLITVSAAMVINRRAGYIVATLGGLLYGILLDLQYYGVLPIPYDPDLAEKEILYKIFSHFAALYLIAFLTGRLTTRIERKDIDIETLTLFNTEVIENTPSGLFSTTPEGTVVLFNRAAEEITGLSREDAHGQNISAIFPFITSPRAQRRSEAVVRFGDAEKVIGLSVSCMRDAGGRETGFIGVFQDLTELKRLAEEIKKKEKLAAVGELSAKIAHEIRNPLASLKGSMELLRENAVSPGQRERLMGIALAEMDRLNSIITDFLDYSKPSAPMVADFDLNAVLGETLEMLGNSGATGISVRRAFDGPLPVKADSQKLQQVFWNLGLNALDAMPGGGELSVHTRTLDGSVEITFSDTGAGIRKEDLEKIFFPFFTTKSNGTGLGLSIAYRIVEDHGGSIAVESAPGKGSRFRVRLPRREK